MPRVAFIGLGRMGHGMAGRYLDAGFEVAVWNRSKARAGDLVARGAHRAASPAEAAVDADAVVTMVADDDASRAVWLSGDGAAASMKPGALAIECSTVSHAHALDMARNLRARGLAYIDCPVTGLPEAAPANFIRPAANRTHRPFSQLRMTVELAHHAGIFAGCVRGRDSFAF